MFSESGEEQIRSGGSLGKILSRRETWSSPLEEQESGGVYSVTKHLLSVSISGPLPGLTDECRSYLGILV